MYFTLHMYIVHNCDACCKLDTCYLMLMQLMQHARSVEGLWYMGEGPSMHRPTSTVYLLCPYHNEHETSVPNACTRPLPSGEPMGF